MLERDVAFEKQLKESFASLQGDLVTRLHEIAQREVSETGVFMEIAGGENDMVLGINSDGVWSGLSGTHEWKIGKNPKMPVLLSNYALASGDLGYLEAIKLSVAEKGKSGRITEYLRANREILLTNLLRDMADLLDELTPFVDDRKTGLMAV